MCICVTGLINARVVTVQMEMLATGVQSALLVSRSVTRGIHIFRMARDDAYLTAMLTFLSQLYVNHVLQASKPLHLCSLKVVTPTSAGFGKLTAFA